MQQEGYAGTLEVLNVANNLWGWQAADRSMVRADQWQALHDTFVKDQRALGVNEWFETHNPTAQTQLIERMVEAIRKALLGCPGADAARAGRTLASLDHRARRRRRRAGNSRVHPATGVRLRSGTDTGAIAYRVGLIRRA